MLRREVSMSLLRKPMRRVQGVKILAYGVDGSGKSVFGLSFPEVAVLDSESKVGVYEGDPEFGQNIVAVADTSNYYDTLDVIEEVIKNDLCKTLMIDSETYIKEAMEVAAMETEEERAKKKGGNIDDQTVSMRGYGKIKLNSNRMRLLKAQASAKGINIISTAHKEDVLQKVGSENVKIGEKPVLRKNAQHDYDVILRFFKERDMATGRVKYCAEVEKDTTRVLNVGQVVENASYDLFRQYFESRQGLGKADTRYDKNIEKDMETMKNEDKNHDDLVEEFVTLFKDMKAKSPEKAAVIPTLLKEHGIDSYKKPEHFEALQSVVAKMKQM